MKQGEKRVLLVVLTAFIAVIVLTISLERNNQRANPRMENNQRMQATLGVNKERQAMQHIPKDINPQDLPDAQGSGASKLVLYCVQCHDLPIPTMHSQQEWPQVLQRMRAYMDERRGGLLNRMIIPAAQDWQTLESYLIQHGQRGLEPGTLTDLNSPQGTLFAQTCGQCHALPDPRQHRASEWPRTVLRMQRNMQLAGVEAPERSTLDEIIDYLQRHAH